MAYEEARFIEISVLTDLALTDVLQDVLNLWCLEVSQLFSKPLASSQPSCSITTKSPIKLRALLL